MYSPRPIHFLRTLVCRLFRILGFCGRQYFKCLVPTPFFGSLLHCQNFNRTPSQYCQLGRLIGYDDHADKMPGLCCHRAQWPLAPNFCFWASRKSRIFYTNHMQGTLDFTGSEHWATFNFP